jgi:hypothetical protein
MKVEIYAQIQPEQKTVALSPKHKTKLQFISVCFEFEYIGYH